MLELVIAIGGGLGALTRYRVSLLAQGSTPFPLGTFLINITGSCLLGFLIRYLEGTAIAPEWRAFFTIGFCGGYTTFSTFSYETMRMLRDGEWSLATTYISGSFVLSLIGVFAGFSLAGAILRGRR